MSAKIICITPIRNEAWILDTFLKSARLWADHIILVDQNSSDDSKKIIENYDNVIVLDYNSDKHSQIERRRLLLETARRYYNNDNNLILAIDADEVLTPEAFNKDTWKQLLNKKPGTVFQFQWATLLPNIKKYWTGYHLPYGFIDDGRDYIQQQPHHGTRIPVIDNNPIYNVNEFKVIHFQYMNPERNTSRQRWYQCLELVDPSIATDAIDIYRKYHTEQTFLKDRINEIPENWIEQYKNLGIELLKIYKEEYYWYDDEVRKLFDQYGYNHFKKLAIWDDVFKENDPRTLIDKLIHYYLKKSQPHYFTKARKIDNIIKKVLKY